MILDSLDAVLFAAKVAAGDVCFSHFVLLTWEDGERVCDVCKHASGRLSAPGTPRQESKRAIRRRTAVMRGPKAEKPPKVGKSPKAKRPQLKICVECDAPFFYHCVRCSTRVNRLSKPAGREALPGDAHVDASRPASGLGDEKERRGVSGSRAARKELVNG